jgi:hypothetical protein
MARKALALGLVVAAMTIAAPAPVATPLIEPLDTAAAAEPPGPPAVEALRAWDALRAGAWARGDLTALAALYVPGSVAGRRDRAMLRAWVSRGLVVRGMQTQLLEVRELRRTASVWTLVVTDRMVGGFAVGTSMRRPLPRDAPTTRTVELRRVGGRWLVSAVELLDPGA